MNDAESRIICRNDNIFVNNIAFGIRSVFLLRNQLQRVDIQISHCRNLQCDRFRNVHDQTVVFGSDARTGEADRCGFRRIIFIQLDKGSLAVLAAVHAAFDASVNMFFFTHTQGAVRGFQCQVTALRNRVVKGIVLPCFDGNLAVYGTNLMNRAVFGNCNIKQAVFYRRDVGRCKASVQAIRRQSTVVQHHIVLDSDVLSGIHVRFTVRHIDIVMDRNIFASFQVSGSARNVQISCSVCHRLFCTDDDRISCNSLPDTFRLSCRKKLLVFVRSIDRLICSDRDLTDTDQAFAGLLAARVKLSLTELTVFFSFDRFASLNGKLFDQDCSCSFGFRIVVVNKFFRSFFSAFFPDLIGLDRSGSAVYNGERVLRFRLFRFFRSVFRIGKDYAAVLCCYVPDNLIHYNVLVDEQVSFVVQMCFGLDEIVLIQILLNQSGSINLQRILGSTDLAAAVRIDRHRAVFRIGLNVRIVRSNACRSIVVEQRAVPVIQPDRHIPVGSADRLIHEVCAGSVFYQLLCRFRINGCDSAVRSGFYITVQRTVCLKERHCVIGNIYAVFVRFNGCSEILCAVVDYSDIVVFVDFDNIRILICIADLFPGYCAVGCFLEIPVIAVQIDRDMIGHQRRSNLLSCLDGDRRILCLITGFKILSRYFRGVVDRSVEFRREDGSVILFVHEHDLPALGQIHRIRHLITGFVVSIAAVHRNRTFRQITSLEHHAGNQSGNRQRRTLCCRIFDRRTESKHKLLLRCHCRIGRIRDIAFFVVEIQCSGRSVAIGDIHVIRLILKYQCFCLKIATYSFDSRIIADHDAIAVQLHQLVAVK